MEITTRQAAERLGVTPGRIRQLITAGLIKPRYLTPRMLLIDERELKKPGVAVRPPPGRPAAKTSKRKAR